MLFIGESINATLKSVGRAILSRDESFVRALARKQVEAGAEMLDVNAGTGEGNEVEDLKWAVTMVQQEVGVPVCIDSSDPDAIKAAAEVHDGSPMINSISAEKKKMQALLPLLPSIPGCKVVAICVGDSGIPKTAEERVDLARFLVGELEGAGMQREDIYVDPVTLSVAPDSDAGMVMLDTLAGLKEELPGVRSILAVSNVGFGLPVRSNLNRALAVLSIERDLDALLCDVTDRSLMLTAAAADVVLGRDPYCGAYLKTYRRLKGS